MLRNPASSKQLAGPPRGEPERWNQASYQRASLPPPGYLGRSAWKRIVKLPTAHQSVTLCDGVYEVPYPPLGFCSIAEHQLGNGDTFGFYWPIGREDHDPIVAETYHDEWSIQPHFSSLDCFLLASANSRETDHDDELDDDSFVGTPTLNADPRSPAACLLAARDYLKSQDFDGAIECLETAVSVLPEYSEAQALLCTQYRRIGKHDAAIRTAIQAIVSPSCFGPRPIQIVKWLASQSSCPAEIESDPIWMNRERLTLKLGCVKENDEYRILRDAIDAYLADSSFIPAMTLMQTYAQLMYSETVSFQERYKFNPKEFVAWQRDVAETQYGKTRVLEA